MCISTEAKGCYSYNVNNLPPLKHHLVDLHDGRYAMKIRKILRHKSSGHHMNVQRITQSASLINLFLSPASFLLSSAIDTISKSSRPANRSRTWSPVVPASPSIKIFFLASSSELNRVGAKDRDGVNADVGFVDAMERKSEKAQVLVIMIYW